MARASVPNAIALVVISSGGSESRCGRIPIST
jgi:hypothetical protein